MKLVHAPSPVRSGSPEAPDGATGPAKRRSAKTANSLFNRLFEASRAAAAAMGSPSAAKPLAASKADTAAAASGEAPGGRPAAKQSDYRGSKPARGTVASGARPFPRSAAAAASTAGGASAGAPGNGVIVPVVIQGAVDGKAKLAAPVPDAGAGHEKAETEAGPAKNDAKAAARDRRRGVVEGAGYGPVETDGNAASGAPATAAAAANVLGKAAAAKKPDESAAASTEAKRKDKDKRSERVNLEVFDYRSSSVPSGQPSPVAEKAGGPAAADLTLGSAAWSDRTSGEAGDSGPAAAAESRFAELLSRELRETANADIVQRASVVLKDGGDGVIRLALKPESLGAVKIRLDVADNVIAGKIVVESEAALRAFEQELRSLEQAFRDGGFDGASLELALSADGGRDGGAADGDGPRPYFSERDAAGSYEAAIGAPPVTADANGAADGTIDVLA